MNRFTIGLVVLAALAVTFRAPAEETVDVKKMVAEFKKAMKSKDPAERKAAIATVSTAKDPKIAAALAKHLRDRDMDVRAAVCRAVGAQGDAKAGLKLISMLKSEEDNPEVLVAVCDGIAGVPHPKAVEPLEDIVKDVFNKLKEPEVAKAAIRALGQIKHKSTIEPLILLCGRTNPVAGTGGSGGGVSDETRAFLSAFKPDIIEALKNVTGLQYKSPPVWMSWWKENERGFKIPEGPEDLSTVDRYTDYGYRFRISRPAESWKWSRPTEATAIIRMGHPEEGNETQHDADVVITGWDVSEYTHKTPESRVHYWDDWVKESFRDVKETHAKKINFAGEKGAYEWYAKGLYGSGVVEIRRIIILRKNLLFEINITSKTSISQPLRDDLEKVVKSISFF